MRIAVLCSSHGFGHLTRQLALCEELLAAGAEPVVFTAAPPEVVWAYLPDLAVVPWAIDVGIAQQDSLTEDLDRTLELLEERCSEQAVDRLAARLAGRFDRAVVDIPPAALEACRRAGLPCVAVGNFDWAWIYSHYPELRGWSRRFLDWQSGHRAIQLRPGPDLTGFGEVLQGGLVARRRPAHPLPEGSVLVSFGGFGLNDLHDLLPIVPGVTWVLSPPMRRLDRPDVLWLEDVCYPSLVAGAGLVLSKPGYGILGETSAAGTALAWIPRGAFPEAPFLVAALEGRGDRQVRGDLSEIVHELMGRSRPLAALDNRRVAGWMLGPEGG
jgi:hypothetical protein